MSKPRQDLRLLLVEDNTTNQEVALRILQHLGYSTVQLAADGKQALAALKSQDFDLVLMDCHLPDMDGYETARRIRTRDSGVRNHEIPIVATTAAVMDSDRRKCFAAGMNGYVAKPLRFEALEQAIEQWTGGKTTASPPPPPKIPQPETRIVPFDREEFAESVMGNDALAQRIVRGFVNDMPRQIALLAQAVDDGDSQRVRLLAHSIKGAAASVSGKQVRDASSKLEQQARDGNLAFAAEALRDLAASFERTKPVMERFCREEPGE